LADLVEVEADIQILNPAEVEATQVVAEEGAALHPVEADLARIVILEAVDRLIQGQTLKI
jgi:hypothetical protein